VNSPASSPSVSQTPAFIGALSSASLWKTVAVGTFAGLLAFFPGELVFRAFEKKEQAKDIGAALSQILAVSSLWVGVLGLVIGLILLSWDNASSLRGKWFRDLGPGIPLFGFLGLASGAAAQIIYSIGMIFVAVSAGLKGQNELSGGVLVMASLIRGLGWAVFGAGVGASIGILRGDSSQTTRGALGGALGGFVGGALFNFISVAMGNNAAEWLPRLLGVVLLGAFLGGATRLVQETLKSAWLLGISTGPYEGKEYPLGKARVSVGRAGNCDLSLFRDESLAPQLGALVFQSGGWFWQGEAIPINGAVQTGVQIFPGARLQIGQTLFRFNDRSKSAPRDPFAPISPPQGSYPAQSQDLVASAPSSPVNPAPAPVPVSWTFSPAIGNTLTGWRFEANRASATIGRAEGNDWQLRDDGTSSRHARLDRSGDAITLSDLGSTNGTFINGQKLAPNSPIELRGRETIRVGRTQWTVTRGS